MAQRTDYDVEAAGKLWSMIKDIRVAMLTTTDEDGSLRARPMAGVQKDFDGVLWFFTRAGTHKVLEIEAHHAVNLAYVDSNAQHYVSVSGHAELSRDKAKAGAIWSEALAPWFPKGLDDPELALLKVTVDKGEYWDAPSSAMVHAYGIVKSKLTG